MTTRTASLPRSLTFALVLGMAALSLVAGSALAAPEDQMTWAVHVSIAPLWFDPADTPGIITPYMFLYALHDAVLKPMPGNPYTPSLAESWSESKDGRTYEFVLRKGRSSTTAISSPLRT